MKYSLNWIKKYVPLDESLSIADLKEKVWLGLSEVEDVIDYGKNYHGILIAKVESVIKHPNADKLQLVTIDLGDKGKKQIVTGAQNVRAGDFVPYIPVGNVVPSTVSESSEGVYLESKNFMGIDSEGMLASEVELNLGDDHSGILLLQNKDVLSGKLAPGMDFSEAVGLNDTILEIENKTMTHRGDSFSIIGLAHEISALTGIALTKSPWINETKNDPTEYTNHVATVPSVKITIDSQVTYECPRFSAVALGGITIKKSPLWLRVILAKHDIASVNTIVDITNYIMLEWGQPMHAYDLAKIGGENVSFVVRKATAGEKILALDGKEHILDEQTLVIANQKEVLGIAGIIGGKNSSVSETTDTIVLEAANFDMYEIRRASMRLGIFTDAGTIFSRKQDPAKTISSILEAVSLIKEVTGAEVISDIADYYPAKRVVQEITLSLSRVREFIGVVISDEQIVDYLEKLHYSIVKNGDLVTVMPPSFRTDIGIDEDVYEDIARLYGYQNIVPQLPTRNLEAVFSDETQSAIWQTKKVLAQTGLVETFNLSFIAKREYDDMGLSIENCYKIANAISPDVQYIRKFIVPGLILQMRRSQHIQDIFGIFEYGKVMSRDVTIRADNSQEYGLPVEERRVALGMFKKNGQVFYDLKAKVLSYLRQMELDVVTVIPVNAVPKEFSDVIPSWAKEIVPVIKKGRAIYLFTNKQEQLIFLGILGEISVRVMSALDVRGTCAVCELSLDTIIELPKQKIRFIEPSVYPSLEKDYTFEVDEQVTYEKIIRNILNVISKQGEGDIHVQVTPVSIYHREIEHKKRVTFSFEYQSYTRTLSDKDISPVESSVLTALQSEFNAIVV